MRFRFAFLSVSYLCLALLFPVMSGDLAAQGDPLVLGRWSFFPNLPFYPVHTHVLPTGKVMMWPGDLSQISSDVYSWEPATGVTAPLSRPGYDVFCAGHVFLADGRMF